MTVDNLANLLGMGRSAELAGNNDEAISYYNRVLEADPTVPEAWLGKGRAAGWKSTLAHLRIGETLVAFRNAIGAASDEDKPAIADQAARDLVILAGVLWGMTWKHYQDFSSTDGVWASTLAASATVLDALVGAREWKRDDPASWLLTIEISKHILDHGVTVEYGTLVKAGMDEAVAELQAIDPTYERPALAETTEVEKAAAKADSDALGYIVAFIMMIVLGVVTVVMR